MGSGSTAPRLRTGMLTLYPSPQSLARVHTALSGRTHILSSISTPRLPPAHSAATNNQTGEGVAIKKVTNVFSKKILAKRALREIKLLQHFRGECIAAGVVGIELTDLL